MTTPRNASQDDALADLRLGFLGDQLPGLWRQQKKALWKR